MFPYKIEKLEENLNKKLMSMFTGERNGFCQVGPKKWVLPVAYKDHAENYYNFQPRSDDVWVLTYPRSGTTFCQELAWLINNNFDYEKAATIPLEKRFPFFEFSILHSVQFHEDLIAFNNNRPEVIEKLAFWRQPGYEFLKEEPSPRHIKSHLPISLLPPNLLDTSKVVYIARNPKDVAVSYYHHNKLLKVHGYIGEFEEYWNYFEKDVLVYSPYWEHVKEGWEVKNHKNVLFLFYEDLIKDLSGNIKKVASFLNKPINDEQLKKLVNHLQIDNFRAALKVHGSIEMEGVVNKSGQGFIRKGQIGGNNEFTPELIERADKWIADNLAKTDLTFPEKK
ncbi:sulfotransferase 1C4-like isoform X2 [Rhodnius prolixus]|uniref:sulfotransferase 1C4-like isoform X2 n=1 Tax=Rhodnius prolixus TaxID=13249 RepID=UPI003D18C254